MIIIPEQIEHMSGNTSDKAGKNEWNSLEPPSSLEEDIRLLFICDLGRFHLWSQQQNKDSLLGTSSARAAGSDENPHDMSSAKHAKRYDENDEKFYDRYRLRLSEIQMLLVRGAEPWRTAPSQLSTLVHKFECIIDLHASILPQDPTIARAKMYGKLPKIYGKISTRTRRNLMQLMGSFKQNKVSDEHNESNSALISSNSHDSNVGSGQWGNIAASATTAVAAGFGNPVSIFARARSVAAAFSPSSRPRHIRQMQATGSSKLSQSMFAFPSPSAKYRRFTRSPSPLNIGLADGKSAFRASANAATSSTTEAKQMKTNNSKKANCKLFDLHLSLGSVVIDVSESTVRGDLSTQRENIHISDSAQAETPVAQFALKGLGLTSSIESRTLNAEIALSDVTVKDMSTFNGDLSGDILKISG